MVQQNAAVIALDKQGGKARLKTKNAQQRSEAARKAVQDRWAREKEQ